ncbi:hypothetical protein EMCRGX_G031802 [Ephydatia muelleri]
MRGSETEFSIKLVHLRRGIADLALRVPRYLTLFLTQSIFLVSLIFVGHITGKALEIDAAGLAIAVINMTGFSVIHGMGTAVDTLCSQVAAMWAWGLHKQMWGGWSWESLVDWWTFTKLAIPGLLMVGFEWWSKEVGIIVVSIIGKKELAVYTNVVTFLFMNALSISFATSIRVGNELGAGNTQRAKRVFYISLVLTVCEALVLAVGLQGLKYQLGGMFTYDETVIKGVAKLMNVVPFFVFFDHIQGALAGVLRGCGRQVLGAVSNFVCFYIIGLPIGVCLALVAEMGAIGFWIGLLCGSTIQRTAEGHTASLLNKGRRRSGCSKCFRGLSSSKTRLVLYRGSFFLVASIILIAGGIGSHFKLPLAEGNTTNTTSCGEGSMLNTTVLFSSGLPDNGVATMASCSLPPPLSLCPSYTAL